MHGKRMTSYAVAQYLSSGGNLPRRSITEGTHNVRRYSGLPSPSLFIHASASRMTACSACKVVSPISADRMEDDDCSRPGAVFLPIAYSETFYLLDLRSKSAVLTFPNNTYIRFCLSCGNIKYSYMTLTHMTALASPLSPYLQRPIRRRWDPSMLRRFALCAFPFSPSLSSPLA